MSQRLHKCFDRACEVQVTTELIGCREHWLALPRPLRDRIWKAWRAGKTIAWFEAVQEARELIDRAEPASHEYAGGGAPVET